MNLCGFLQPQSTVRFRCKVGEPFRFKQGGNFPGEYEEKKEPDNGDMCK